MVSMQLGVALAVVLAATADQQIDDALNAKDFVKAESLARAVTEATPNENSGWAKLSIALQGQGKFKEALAALEQLENRHGNPVFIALRRARAYARLGNLDAAFADLEKATKLGFAARPMLEGEPDYSPLKAD